MKQCLNRKSLPVLATTALAVVAFTVPPFFSDGSSSQTAKADEVNRHHQRPEKPNKGLHSKDRTWLDGDHHVHSEWSVGWDNSKKPPEPIQGGDGIHPIALNAKNAEKYGLDWMVSTDHGGPNHSKINLEKAYPDLLKSRKAVPEVLQFFGMELDTPAADHSTLMIPETKDESKTLYSIEKRFSKREAYPTDPNRDKESKMIDALNFMKHFKTRPLLFANHPSRSANGYGIWGDDTPQEFRNWNDTAPDISVGMEGAPGHQASAINKDGSIDPNGARGSYKNAPTMGGFANECQSWRSVGFDAW